MGRSQTTQDHVARIMNAAYMVRYRNRGIRLESQAAKRAEAIQHMGVVVRDAFQQSDDFETLLTAVVDGLSPRPPDF